MNEPKHTPEDLAAALETFIRSGSANGNEAMRKRLLKMVPLIAAAPELLEMLQEAVSVINGLADQQAMDDPFYVPTLDAAEALIRKAKGEAQ